MMRSVTVPGTRSSYLKTGTNTGRSLDAILSSSTAGQGS
jgi:hypothetical protein